MTSPLRRKRRITVPGMSWRTRMAVSLLSLGLVLGGRAAAQEGPGLMALPSSTATFPAAPVQLPSIETAPSPVTPPTPPTLLPEVSGTSVSVSPEPASFVPPTAPREKVLQFTREPVQPMTRPVPVAMPTPTVQALGTVQVSPAYTGPVVMPTAQPALEPSAS